MKAYERKIAREFGMVVMLAEPDVLHLREISQRNTSILRVPYAVEVDYFARTRRCQSADSPVFVFVGRLNYLPNADAVNQLITDVWPQLKERWRHGRLRVIGAQPGPRLRSLVASSGVELVADVEDVRTELQDANALLVPMRIGSGVQTKILEAMAARVPVVCSTFANVGLGAEPGHHLLLADSPEEYVQQCQRIIRSKDFERQLVEDAYEWVASRHSVEVFDETFVRSCGELLGRFPHG
jgi:glycosyltransferase involved in cell wall biosynthesis